MRNTLTIAIAVLALGTAACGRKQAAPEPVPPAEQVPPGETVAPGDVELVELPAAQADLVAKAGSDTVYFGTDEYALDACLAGDLGRASALADRQPQRPRLDRGPLRRAWDARI